MVRLIELDGEEFLFYPCRPIDVAFLRGTTGDAEGNVTMEREAATLDSLSIAQATKNSGGIVIVQVERVTTRHMLPPRDVRIPGIRVDGLVVAEDGTSICRPSPRLTTPPTSTRGGRRRLRGGAQSTGTRAMTSARAALDVRKVIARRAAMLIETFGRELWNWDPRGDRRVAGEEGILDLVTLTVEAGAIGGLPAGGLSFGAVAVRRQSSTSPTSSTSTTAGDSTRHSWGGAGRPPRQRQRQPLRSAASRRRWLHQHQSGRAERVFPRNVHRRRNIDVGEGRLQIRREGPVEKFVDEVGM